MLSLLWFLIIGLIIGALGRFVVPGRNPMPWWLTLLLGVVGALVGGWVTGLIIGGGHGIISFIVSVVVAAILVVVVGNVQKKSRSRA